MSGPARSGRRSRARTRRRVARVVAVVPAEVDARGRLDPVGAVAEVDRVEVVGQDLPARPLLHQLEGERRPRAASRRSCGCPPPARTFLTNSSGIVEPPSVGPPVRSDTSARSRPLMSTPGIGPEALVLNRDDRVNHRLRDLAPAVAHRLVRRREHADRLAGVVVEVGVD